MLEARTISRFFRSASLLAEVAGPGLHEPQRRQADRGDEAHRVAVLAHRDLPSRPAGCGPSSRGWAGSERSTSYTWVPALPPVPGEDPLAPHHPDVAAAQQDVVADEQQLLGVRPGRQLPVGELARCGAGDVGDDEALPVLEPYDDPPVGLGHVGLVDLRLLGVGAGGAVRRPPVVRSGAPPAPLARDRSSASIGIIRPPQPQGPTWSRVWSTYQSRSASQLWNGTSPSALRRRCGRVGGHQDRRRREHARRHHAADARVEIRPPPSAAFAGVSMGV